jgi:hypothetical protein
MIIEKLLTLIEGNLTNALAWGTLLPSMSPEEQELVNEFITSVVDGTSLLDLQPKEAINYMKLYLKTRKERVISLEELVNDTQRERLERLG